MVTECVVSFCTYIKMWLVMLDILCHNFCVQARSLHPVLCGWNIPEIPIHLHGYSFYVEPNLFHNSNKYLSSQTLNSCIRKHGSTFFVGIGAGSKWRPVLKV